MEVVDLFSAACGGWSLGMHRAGFKTIAACESVAWRRALYAENNPGVPIYDDVCTLTADRLVRDLGRLPDIIVGSPPCQDISSANTKGKGVDGERSGLFFEAVRLIGECRPRWFALENSANLRTRGADRVLAALEALGYACEPCVVGADNAGANHERKRSWLIGYDADQILKGPVWPVCERPHAQHQGGDAPDTHGVGRDAGRRGRRLRLDLPAANDPEHAAGLGCESGRPRRHGADGDGASPAARGVTSDADEARHAKRKGQRGDVGEATGEAAERDAGARRDDGPHADHEGQPDGAEHDEVGGREGTGADARGPWAEWNGSFARHLRLDAGLSAWVAEQRIAVGGPRGTAASSLLVEAFGDSVIPQIPEAIGRAILRTEAALSAILSNREAA